MVIQILVKELEWKPKLVSKWEKERKHGSTDHMRKPSTNAGFGII